MEGIGEGLFSASLTYVFFWKWKGSINKMIKDMKSIRFRVTYILEIKPELRDNIMEFVLEYWKEFDDMDSYIRSGGIFFDNWFNEKATSFETIRRAWQKIQQLNPSLRGKYYNKRHQKGEQTRFTIVEDGPFIVYGGK